MAEITCLADICGQKLNKYAFAKLASQTFAFEFNRYRASCQTLAASHFTFVCLKLFN
jgi:hypothetical protein